MTIIIKNGMIVTDKDIFVADIEINNHHISNISSTIDYDVEIQIDATDRYIFPGFIDAHTHMELPISDEISSVDDFYTGTVAAAFGGTTSIIDYIVPYQGQDLVDAFYLWNNKAKGKAIVDYGFHMTISDPTDEHIDQIKDLPSCGITSVKCFTAYVNKFMMTDDKIYRILEESKDTKMLACIHCENGYVLNYKIKQFLKQNKTAPKYHPQTRPDLVEAEAIGRVIDLAKLAQSPIFIAHLSTSSGLERIISARNEGYKVFSETCPQYLILSDDVFNLEGFESAKYVCSPPIRNKNNIEPLWKGIFDDYIQVFATDHCPFNYNKEKQRGVNNFTLIPNGLPGVEDRVNIMFSEGVIKRKLDLKKFVSLNSTMPAKIFGLYPQKGAIQAGADADLVIYDPAYEWVISAQNHHQNVDYNVYEGLKITGKPEIVISRGEIIIKDNNFLGKKGRGEYLKRNTSSLFE